jgi:hypothetical protein
MSATSAAVIKEDHAYMNGTRGLLLHEALDRVWGTVARANEYVQRESPWLLAKDSSRRRDVEGILASLFAVLSAGVGAGARFFCQNRSSCGPRLAGRVSFRHTGSIGSLSWIQLVGGVKRGEALFPKTSTALRTRPTDIANPTYRHIDPRALYSAL